MTVSQAGYGGLAARLEDLGDTLAAMKVRGGLPIPLDWGQAHHGCMDGIALLAR